ncbi:hypothetical protein [Streptomyces mirabilis]|uniref:hypothetical protein n=1 Tax=Streptomyces mirabilis TaxID=68239 RepID=UPI00339F1A87
MGASRNEARGIWSPTSGRTRRSTSTTAGQNTSVGRETRRDATEFRADTTDGLQAEEKIRAEVKAEAPPGMRRRESQPRTAAI